MRVLGSSYAGDKYHVRKDADTGRRSMAKRIAGEERDREGPYRVECPRCGARPGFACRKPGGQINYDAHLARREKAGGRA